LLKEGGFKGITFSNNKILNDAALEDQSAASGRNNLPSSVGILKIR
jgi:hypothetical protein